MSNLSTPWAAEALAVELLDAIAVPAWLHRDGLPPLPNLALARLCAWPANHRPGPADHLGMVVSSSRSALASATEACLAGVSQPPALPAQLLTHTGSQRAVELTLRRVQLGGQTAALVTCVDLSDILHVQGMLTSRLEQLTQASSHELAAHARVMDAFIDNAPVGVLYVERNRVLRSNRHMAEILGPADPADPDMAASGFYMSLDDLKQLRQATRRALARGRAVHLERWLRHRDGQPVWVQINAYAVQGRDKATGTWWMVQDRSEVRAAQAQLHSRIEELKLSNDQLEQAQNQLLQADKMACIGQLAAGVAHEINNPVAFVSSNLHTMRLYADRLLRLAQAHELARAFPANADIAADLACVHADVELDYLKLDLPQLLDESAEGLLRVKKIVNDLKDFSRVDQSDWQQADLNAGLESTLNVVRHVVKHKAEVLRQLAPLPPVTCLAGQLNQVFMNLIVNATQAITGHGRITLSSGSQDDWVWVQVDDTGCGMPPEVQRRVFEPFFTTKGVGKGTGLGLSLSFSIVKRHGGEIQMRSAPGLGSSFRLWVPVGGPTADSAAHSPSQSPGQGASGPPAPPPAWA